MRTQSLAVRSQDLAARLRPWVAVTLLWPAWFAGGTAARAGLVTASYLTGRDIPVTADGFNADGETLALALGFAPVEGTSLMVIDNTSLEFIDGEFDNLANGQTVEIEHGGTAYPFVAWYFGGDGNDLVLLWPYTGIAGWGLNLSGQLGDASSRNRQAPSVAEQTGVLAGKTIVQIERGTSHTLALASDGAVYAWGDNGDGQLGDGTTVQRFRPVAVNRAEGTSALHGKSVVAVAAGRSHSMALCSDGTIAAWGVNVDGRLGDGTTESRLVPAAVAAGDGTSALFGKTAVRIAAGRTHSLALCSDGTLASWGGNLFGQLGDNTLTNREQPVRVSTQAGVSALAGKSVVAIAVGRYHNLALCSDGAIAAWGANEDGRLGDNSIVDRHAPVLVSATPGVSALAGKTPVGIAAGAFHSLALCSDGTVASWGENNFGQLGDGSAAARRVPTGVWLGGALAGRQVAEVAAGLYHSLARCTDGTMAAWGNNIFGQLGDNSTSERRAPVAVSTAPGTSVLAGRRVSALAGAGAEGGHSLAIYSLDDHIALPEPEPDIVVEQPSSADLPDGASRHLGTVHVNEAATMRFTVRNTGEATLTGLGITISGPDAASFAMTAAPSAPLPAPHGVTTFTIRFAPVTSGRKSASLEIASNDPDESPFTVGLLGLALSRDEDTDSDGLSDWAESRLAGLGFDWETPQPSLVQLLFANAGEAGLFDQAALDAARQAGHQDVAADPNRFGLYTQAQLDAQREAGRQAGRAEVVAAPNQFGLYDQNQYDAHWVAGRAEVLDDPNAYQLFTFTQVDILTLGAPLLKRDPATGKFCLTLGIEMSTDLRNYSPFPFELDGVSVDGSGGLKFTFDGPDESAFFRVLGRGAPR